MGKLLAAFAILLIRQLVPITFILSFLSNTDVFVLPSLLRKQEAGYNQ